LVLPVLKVQWVRKAPKVHREPVSLSKARCPRPMISRPRVTPVKGGSPKTPDICGSGIRRRRRGLTPDRFKALWDRKVRKEIKGRLEPKGIRVCPVPKVIPARMARKGSRDQREAKVHKVRKAR